MRLWGVSPPISNSGQKADKERGGALKPVRKALKLRRFAARAGAGELSILH